MNESTDKSDDVLLSAMVDGELTEDEERKLADRLATEPVLARRLASMRAADNAARQVFHAVDSTPMPERVLQMLANPASDTAHDNVVAFPQRGLRQFLQLPVAIAASVALMAGFLFSEYRQQVTTTALPMGAIAAGEVAPESSLHQLLETGLSGQAVDLGQGASGAVMLSFESTDGQYCRQLGVDFSDRSAYAIACRSAGAWQIDVVALGSGVSPGGAYQQAAERTPEAVDSTVDRLIGAGEPLDQEQERSMISAGWEKSGN